MIINSKEQIEQMESLTIKQKKELCTYLGRAQGRNKDYVIECDGDGADSLLAWWQQHQQKAAARSQKRASRQPRQNRTAERRQQSLAEECFAVISEVANVRDKSIEYVIKNIKEQIVEIRRVELVKAKEAAKQAAEKVNDFKAKYSKIIMQYETLTAEQQKQQERSERLQIKTVRSKQQEPSEKQSSYQLY